VLLVAVVAGLAAMAPRSDEIDQRLFEQRLVEEIADDVGRIATERFRDELASSRGRSFDIGDGEQVKLIAVDLYDVGGMLITVETEDGRRYLVRLEIRSGHYAFEAVPLEGNA
jgi:hypothetical protein